LVVNKKSSVSMKIIKLVNVGKTKTKTSR